MKFYIKILIIISAFFFYTKSNAQESAELGQVIAQKIKSNVLQGKALAEAILQYESMLEQSKTLTAMKDVYSKVSKGVKKYAPVKNSVQYMYYTIEMYSIIIKSMQEKKTRSGKNIYSSEDINRIDQKLIGIIQSNTQNIKDLKSVLKDDNVKMNDGERMEIINIIEKRTRANYEKTVKIYRFLN